MYISEQHTVFIIPLMILLLATPLLILSINLKFFRQFTFKKFVTILNKALLPQIIIGLTTLLIAFILDRSFYANGKGNIFTDIFIETTYFYCIIGLFMYLPSVGILNIIKFWTARLINRTKKND
jgi:hypothetical protein